MLLPAWKYAAATDQIRPNKLHLLKQGSNASAHNKYINNLIHSEYPWHSGRIGLTK